MIGRSPVPLPRDYAQWVNEAEPAELLGKLREHVNTGVSYGS